VKFASEDREERSPPGLELMGASLEWGVRGKEGSHTGKLGVEPGFKGGPSRKGRKRKDG